MAHRAFSTHPLVVRRAEVLRVAEVTSRMRRVTLGGAELGAFERDGWRRPAFRSPGFDDHVKLIFAADGDVRSALPVQVEHGIEWGPSQTRQGRDYTPRAVRVDGGRGTVEVDLDFVLHGDGPAASWAQSATVGDELWFVGPKSSALLPDGVRRVVLVGDETALPAIGRFLDERPLEVPASIVVVVGDPGARQDLAVRAADAIAWIVGDATDPAVLEDAMRRAVGDAGTEGLYAWAAGESRALLPVRRLLTRELGLARSHVDVTGYWHVEKAEPAAATPAPAEVAAPAGPPPVASPLPWLTVRAALQLGLVDAVADNPGVPAAELAARCGVAARDLDVLLPVLLAHAVLAGDAGALRLGALGEELIDDEHAREGFDGHEAELLLALGSLAPAARAGRAPWAEQRGRTLASGADAGTYAELVEGAGSLAFLVDGLLADPVWDGVGSAAATGPGAGLVVDALARAGRVQRIEVWETPAGLEALRAEAERPGAVTWAPLDVPLPGGGGTAGVVVAAMALSYRTDAEASELLRTLGSRGRTAVVVESSRPDGLSPHAAERGLRAYAATGAPLRDGAAIGALAAGAGWRVARTVPLGWGVEATVLER